MTTILVVDDNPVDRRLAGSFVEKCAGMKAVYAGNGREALAALAEHHPGRSGPTIRWCRSSS